MGGVPRVTSRDGTPSSFTILATADLRHWRSGGQGGWATMGVFTSGRRTVFNAATVNWGNTLHDPVVDRITRNVLDRLTSTRDGWDVIGEPADIRALAADARVLYGVGAGGALMSRELCAQNLPWRPIGWARDVTCLDTPREAAGTRGVLLYGVTPTASWRSRAARRVPRPPGPTRRGLPGGHRGPRHRRLRPSGPRLRGPPLGAALHRRGVAGPWRSATRSP